MITYLYALEMVEAPSLSQQAFLSPKMPRIKLCNSPYKVFKALSMKPFVSQNGSSKEPPIFLWHPQWFFNEPQSVLHDTLVSQRGSLKNPKRVLWYILERTFKGSFKEPSFKKPLGVLSKEP